MKQEQELASHTRVSLVFKLYRIQKYSIFPDFRHANVCRKLAPRRGETAQMEKQA
jgi:hypothetical protein